jgi:imidazole glycerol-phosphate synthase subunit HisF
MPNVRLIARLDVKGPNLVKTVRMEGLRVLGAPHEFAKRYYQEGADELIYIDIVASLYGRNNLREIVEKTASEIFVPLTVGGGIRSLADVTDLLRSGADKVAINTAAIANPELVRQVARRFGSQCMVLSIEAKRSEGLGWEALTNGGREHSGLSVVDWVQRGVELGAGEILLSSVDQEGTRKGFDIELFRAVAQRVDVPIIGSGGFGQLEHLDQAMESASIDGLAFADCLHYQRVSLGEIRNHAIRKRYPVREL